MPRFGLKLGVHEKEFAAAAERLWLRKRYDFLELYVPIDVKSGHTALWRWYDGFLVLHAPHAAGGFNFAQHSMAVGNAKVIECLEIL